MDKFTRLLKHLFLGDFLVAKHFNNKVKDSISECIQKSESSHGAELRFAVEGGLPLPEILSNCTPRTAALRVFPNLVIWDTEENNGVLIYLLMADRDVEILVDRGLAKIVDPALWEKICKGMEEHFHQKKFKEGVCYGIAEVSKILERHFPKKANDTNEISNSVAVL